MDEVQESKRTRPRWRWLLALSPLAFGAVSATGCRGASGAAAADTVVVGDQRGGIQALLRASGELEDVPYKIDWALFPAASPLLEALSSGAIDIGGVGSSPFAFAYASGAPIKVVFATRQVGGKGSRASAVIVRADSPLRTVADLKGHRIATVRGSAGQNLVLRLLEAAGLSGNDVHWIYLNNGEAKAALASGSIDGWSTWGSYVGIALLEDQERALADATGLEAEAGFYAASDAAIKTKHAHLLDFLKRAARARAWARAHQDEYAKVLADETKIPIEVARFTVRESPYDVVPVTEGLRNELSAIFERYRRAGVVDKVPDLNGAFDTSFNAAAAQ